MLKRPREVNVTGDDPTVNCSPSQELKLLREDPTGVYPLMRAVVVPPPLGLLTVTATAADVAVAFDESVTTAVTVWVPFARIVESKDEV
jgi:hypothetical protein